MLKPIFVTKLIALGLGLATLCTPTPTEAAVLTYLNRIGVGAERLVVRHRCFLKAASYILEKLTSTARRK